MTTEITYLKKGMLVDQTSFKNILLKKNIMKKNALLAASAFLIFCSCNSNSNSDKTEMDTTTAVIPDQTPNRMDTGTAMTATPADSNMVAAVNDMDKQFVMKVGMGNTAEIEAGNLAKEKSANPGIKEFGSMMAMDHGDAQNKLKSIASSLSLTAPDSVDAAHKTAKKKLEGLTGSKFDTEYVNGQIKDHKETIALFEKEIKTGSNSQIKSFASSTLPTIKMHLEKVTALKK